jgi:hypothetical protein
VGGVVRHILVEVGGEVGRCARAPAVPADIDRPVVLPRLVEDADDSLDVSLRDLLDYGLDAVEV